MYVYRYCIDFTSWVTELISVLYSTTLPDNFRCYLLFATANIIFFIPIILKSVFIAELYTFLLIVNGHCKQQLSYTENQQNTVSFSNFIDARLTYNQPMHGFAHRCSTYSERKYNRTIFQRFHKLPYELGGTPFGQWARSAPGPAINSGDTPSPFKQFTQ